MGTNYYLEQEVCDHCGASKKRLHIGKSSAGWCFSLHVEPEAEDHPQSLRGWAMLFGEPKSRIVDEYGNTIPTADMMLEILDRRGGNPFSEKPTIYASWDDFHRVNHSEQGPFGLLRARIGDRCIGHGRGTYDLIKGEFS